MRTTVEEVSGVMPWLSPVVLEHKGTDKSLYSSLCADLPSALSGGSKGEAYMVHVTPGVLQLQCRDLRTLEKRYGEEAAAERKREREDSEVGFRRLMQNLYDAVQGVIDELEARASWIIAGRSASRLLAEEPCLGHCVEVVDFLQNDGLTSRDVDLGSIARHRDMLIESRVPSWIFHRLITAYDDVLGTSQKERKIRFWSAKSRRRLLKSCSELDWAPILERCDGVRWQMAMVTVTYPGGKGRRDWVRYAPTAGVAHKHFKALQERFYRAWGMRMQGIWKREFQKRGAPHLHILMPIPLWGLERKGDNSQGVCPDTRLMFFREWLGWNFAEIVGAEGFDFLNHAQWGTRVDPIEDFSKIKNIAGYFLKYAGKRGRHASKEYQNLPPWEWSQSEEGVGRFWGVIGVERQVRSVLVTKEEFIAWARTLRRLMSANHPGSRVFRANGGAGWLLVEEYSTSVSFVKNLARVISAAEGEWFSTPPVGMRGSVSERMR